MRGLKDSAGKSLVKVDGSEVKQMVNKRLREIKNERGETRKPSNGRMYMSTSSKMRKPLDS
jgi:hypothetical protein